MNAFYGLDIPSSGTTTTSNSILPLNEWIDVSATRDGQTTKIYINGLLDAETQIASGGNIDWNGQVYDNDINAIGAYSHSSNDLSANFYNGIIDDIAIWNRPLNSQEIQELLYEQ